MMEIMKEKGYDRVVRFVPTGWTYEVKRDKFAVRRKDCLEIHLVLYSEHSNYEELREYVRFSKPKKVIPTVGVDVKNADSKHAAKMKKHFAGLVDEMANKQQFLMGFHCTDCQKDEKLVDDLCVESCTSEECVQELKPPDIEIFAGDNPDEIPDGVPDDVSVDVSCLSTYVSQPFCEDSTALSDEEKEVIIKELHDCLPTWVDQGQMLELISSVGRNVVDAVSISPGKRKRNQGSKGNKKARVISNVEGGIKQATITNFFNKFAPVTPQGNSAGNPTTSRSSIDEVALTPSSTTDEPADPMKSKCPDNEHASLADGDKRYEEALEQFMQVTNIGESARNYATTLIERAKGEINLALDIYYNNSQGYQSDNQMKLGSDSKPMLDGGGDYGCSSWQAEAISSEPGKISHSYSTSTSENVALTFVSLPMENYSPVEHACWKDSQPSYIHLTRSFDLLESEKGKIKATSMLCNMFRSLLALFPQDVLPAVYLCTNKIAPDHENMKLVSGGGLVTAALVEARGTNINKIRAMYNRLGDLGEEFTYWGHDENCPPIIGSSSRVSAAVVEAYNILPNLDMLVSSLLSKGIEFSSSILTMVPGISISPILAKYDGQRAQIHQFAYGSVHIFSRNGDEITSRFPDVVHIIPDSCKCSATTFIIDTEVVAVDRRYEGKLLSFQELFSHERGGKRSAVSLDSIEDFGKI
ncbi:DNA ligase 6-like protein [Drosera capensis]